MADDLVNVTIDGMPVSVPKGTPIIEAAKQAGVLVPHYCYHPSLPSPAVCRMCLVEVEKAPKLMPACVTSVAEGQVVHVNSPSAKKARESVLEFLLINHPLDCPICDRRASASSRTMSSRKGAPAPGTPTMPSATIRSRTSVRTSCTCPTAVSCAPGACASWRTWPTRPS